MSESSFVYIRNKIRKICFLVIDENMRLCLYMHLYIFVVKEWKCSWKIFIKLEGMTQKWLVYTRNLKNVNLIKFVYNHV